MKIDAEIWLRDGIGWEMWAVREGTKEEIITSAQILLKELKVDNRKARVKIRFASGREMNVRLNND